MLKDSSTSTKKKLKSVALPKGLQDDTYKEALKHQFTYSIVGIITGVIIILIGVFLIANGFDSTTDEVGLKILGASLDLKKVTPGIILFFIGFFVLYITRYIVKSKNN